MSRRSIWDVLGIAPTQDEELIRKAYAERLKQTNPEDDAEGFKELRAAYEAARRQRHWVRPDNQYDDYEDDYDPEAEGEYDHEREHQDYLNELEDGRRYAPPQRPADPRWRNVPPQRAADPSPERKDEAEPPEPIETPEQAERRREFESYLKTRAALVAALRAGEPEEQLLAKLNAVLKAPAMGHLDTYTQTERWMVEVLHALYPKSEALIQPAIQFFKWTPNAGRIREWAGGASVFSLMDRARREAELTEYLDRVKDKRHEFHRAWRETTMTPEQTKKRGWFGRTFALRHLGIVDRFLQYTRVKFPRGMDRLNYQTVEEWQKRIRWLLQPYNDFRTFAWIVVVIASVAALSFLSGPAPPPSPTTQMESTSPIMPAEVRAACGDALRATRAADSPNSNAANVAALERGHDTCARALQATPNSIQLKQYLGLIELKRLRWQEALPYFDEILAVSPRDPIALYGTAHALQALAAMDSREDIRVPDMAYTALTFDPDIARRLREEFGLRLKPIAPPEEAPDTQWIERPRPRIDHRPDIDRNISQSVFDAAYSYYGLPPFEGAVTLECLVSATGAVKNCRVEEERPRYSGAAEIAINVAEHLHATAGTLEGVAVDNVPVRIPFKFRIAEGPPPAN